MEPRIPPVHSGYSRILPPPSRRATRGCLHPTISAVACPAVCHPASLTAELVGLLSVFPHRAPAVGWGLALSLSLSLFLSFSLLALSLPPFRLLHAALAAREVSGRLIDT